MDSQNTSGGRERRRFLLGASVTSVASLTAAPASSITAMAGLARGAAAAALGLPGAAFAAADNWPSRPVRVLVTNPPGGLTDAYARQYGEYLARTFGQPFVVENRPGAGGTIAADALAKSAPDGHTLMVAIQTPLWNGRVLYRSLPYDPDRSFAPIVLFPAGALVFGVHAKLPIRSPDDFVTWAAKNRASVGSYAAGSWPHMMADNWNRSRKLDIDVIHYKGEAPMWIDVAAGQVSSAMGSYQAVTSHLERGTVRPVAVVGQRRSPRLPDVPTFAEQGHRDPVLALDAWLPMVAPYGTPEPILRRIAEACVAGYQTPKLQQMHESFGIPNGPVGLDETRQRWRDEAPQWVALADQLGIKLD